MTTTILTLLFALMPVSQVVADDPPTDDDVIVISKCIEAKIGEVTDGISGQLRPGVVFLTRSKESGLGFISEAQLKADLEEYAIAELLALFAAARAREADAWRMPAGVTVPGFQVEMAEPPVRGQFVTDVAFSFWAPGFSPDGTEAVVRGAFTPSIHGATLTCVLTKEAKQWRVRESWLRFYV